MLVFTQTISLKKILINDLLEKQKSASFADWSILEIVCWGKMTHCQNEKGLSLQRRIVNSLWLQIMHICVNYYYFLKLK